MGTQKFITTSPVQYHKLLEAPAAEAQRVAEFLGLPLDVQSMARQVDPSLCHVGLT